jgi:sulfate adenylyltransferase subunit 1
VFAVNKLDAVADPALAYKNICGALNAFANEAKVSVTATVPVSALKGWNVVDAAQDSAWCNYSGPTLLQILEQLPVTPADAQEPFAFPVQWVEKNSSSADTSQGRRVFWGRLATGSATVGQSVKILPSGQTAHIAQVLNTVRVPQSVEAGHSAGIVLDREVDVSRGDWLLSNEKVDSAAADDFDDTPQGPFNVTRELNTTVAWMDDEPLVAGRVYLALHGHRWVKARVKRIHHRLDINTLAQEDATELPPNAIGHVELALQEAIPQLPFTRSRVLGSMILVDTASHKTSGALLVHA